MRKRWTRLTRAGKANLQKLTHLTHIMANLPFCYISKDAASGIVGMLDRPANGYAWNIHDRYFLSDETTGGAAFIIQRPWSTGNSAIHNNLSKNLAYHFYLFYFIHISAGVFPIHACAHGLRSKWHADVWKKIPIIINLNSTIFFDSTLISTWRSKKFVVWQRQRTTDGNESKEKKRMKKEEKRQNKSKR